MRLVTTLALTLTLASAPLAGPGPSDSNRQTVGDNDQSSPIFIVASDAEVASLTLDGDFRAVDVPVDLY